MACTRCGGEYDGSQDVRLRVFDPAWCHDCETQYDTWVRKHAADIIWQTGTGAAVAIFIALPGIAFSPIFGIMGFLVGFSTFMGLRSWGKARRRRQFLAGALPRAYLPKQT
jgi:hypothetical protein